MNDKRFMISYAHLVREHLLLNVRISSYVAYLQTVKRG